MHSCLPTIARHVKGVFGKNFADCHFNIETSEPAWDWPTRFLPIYAETPEPWMLEHNALLKGFEATYPPHKVLEKQRVHQECLNRYAVTLSTPEAKKTDATLKEDTDKDHRKTPTKHSQFYL